jgi:para-nitrobenzyl esterase
MRGILAALMGAVLFVGISTQADAAAPLTVAVNTCAAKSSTVTGFIGTYPGSDAPGNMRQFLGIPYAAPPTGANRWMPPKAVTCWNGNRDTKVFGSSCPQGPGLDPWESEDCLTLNVFTKASGAISHQPVMVFIHGGGLISGSGSFQLNPFLLLQEGVVVVTINYRIGALGFLAHSALSYKTGNFGILDQQAALKWVKSNIAKFGGDPANVTIFGQSAGGLSVLMHLVSPLSNALFQKAIIESGSFYYQASPLATAQQSGNSFATAAGCGASATCLRGLSVATILANQGTLGQSTRLLTQDNVVLKNALQTLLMSGGFKKLPTIVGSTHDETRFHINGNSAFGSGGTCAFVSNVVPGNYTNAVQSTGISSSMAAQVASTYPPGASPLTANIALAKQWTDSSYACRTYRVNKWMAQNGGKNFAYEFNDANAPPTLWPKFKLSDNSLFPYGAYHGSELPYLFRPSSVNGCGGAVPAMTSAQKALSGAIVTYWTTFAKTGNPNPASSTLPVWPEFQANGNLVSFVGAKPKLVKATAFDTDHKCTSFWDGKVP